MKEGSRTDAAKFRIPGETCSRRWGILGREHGRKPLILERQARDSADLDAVQQTLLGRPEAFTAIVERYTPLLYSLAFRLTGRREEAEEAVQEIFLRAYRALSRFRLDRRFHPWLYTIALNHLRSRARRLSRRPEGRAEYRDGTVASATPGPEEQAVGREGERLAARALSRLPGRYRDVFVLRQVEGLSVEMTAEILNLPEGTVKNRLHRARRKLAEMLAGEGWGPVPGAEKERGG